MYFSLLLLLLLRLHSSSTCRVQLCFLFAMRVHTLHWRRQFYYWPRVSASCPWLCIEWVIRGRDSNPVRLVGVQRNCYLQDYICATTYYRRGQYSVVSVAERGFIYLNRIVHNRYPLCVLQTAIYHNCFSCSAAEENLPVFNGGSAMRSHSLRVVWSPLLRTIRNNGRNFIYVMMWSVQCAFKWWFPELVCHNPGDFEY